MLAIDVMPRGFTDYQYPRRIACTTLRPRGLRDSNMTCTRVTYDAWFSGGLSEFTCHGWHPVHSVLLWNIAGKEEGIL